MMARRIIAFLMSMALVAGLCPALALATEGQLGAGELTTAVSPSAKYSLSAIDIQYEKRVAEGSKNMNPLRSVKTMDGSALTEGVQFKVEYFKGDNYGDVTARLDAVPTTPGRYAGLIKPASDEYYGMRMFYYQVVGKDSVERAVSSAQEKDVTLAHDVEGATYYTACFDPRSQWGHYTDDARQVQVWTDQGFRTYKSDLNNKSVVFLAFDPNTGQYLFLGNRSAVENRAYTMKGLTYHMPLCVAANEASCALNTTDAVVSNADGYDVSPKKQWVSKASYDNLEKAIAKAEAVAVNKNASKSKVNAATKNLAKAVKAFKPAAGKSNKRISIAKAKISKVESQKYTGKVVKQDPVVKLNGKKLKAGTDYSLLYKNAKGKTIKASNVKAVGKYKLVIKGKGQYKGSVTKSFSIKKAK